MIEFTVISWSEIEWQAIEKTLRLDIKEEEITPERINGEFLLSVGFGQEGCTWQEATEWWQVEASCRNDRNMMTMITHSGKHLAFLNVMWRTSDV